MNLIFDKINLSAQHKVHFEQSEILSAVYHKDQDLLVLKISTLRTVPFGAYQHLIRQLRLYLKSSVDLTIETVENGLEYVDVLQYYDYFVESEGIQSLLDTQINYEDEALFILYESKTWADSLTEDIVRVNELFKKVGIRHTIETKKIEEKEIEVAKAQPVTQKVTTPVQNKENKQQWAPRQNSYSRKKYSDYTFVPLKNLTDDAVQIIVEGELFEVEVRELRSGFAVQYYLRDDTSAIIVNQIHNNKEDILKKKKFYRFYGDYNYDSRPFMNDYIFKYKRVEEIEPMFDRFDNAKEKRVEFHLHTKISEMDGVSDIGEYLEQAMKWGHPGLVVTDHEGVQSFPKAFRSLGGLKKKYDQPDFKLAYGVEMNLAPHDLSIVRNPQGQSIHTGHYVVFDIETTGLSAHYDHIIEFGAVKIIDGQTIDSIQLFIKPPVPIPEFITNLTSITNQDVANAKPIEQAIDDILEFIDDGILVAHNASFDIDFLQEILRKLNRPFLTNTVIDTLDLSRALFENRRSYRLGNIARMMKISYDDDIAHRADYDAEILASVFFNMKRLPEIQAMSTVEEIQSLGVEQGISKARKSHLSVIAKNQAGLKSLYELVSLSYTKYLASMGATSKGNEFVAEPRIVIDEITSRRDNLLIGAGCINSDVFETAMNKSEAALLDVVDYYDFIEIMPLEVYKPLLDRGTLSSERELIRVVERIIAAAKIKNKIIIATGDVHYNHPHDKIVRDVYIHSQGIGGTRHPLYLFDINKRLNTTSPDQHFRTTEEMLNAFPYLDSQDVYKYVIKNPKELLESIEDVEPVKQDLYTPVLEDSDKLLKEIVYRNAYALYGTPLPEIVEERLAFELKSILGHGFGVIYYISHLLVKKSLDDGYLVGSRGSVGSSFVATMAEITEVNPLIPHYVCKKCNHSEFFEDGEYGSGFDLPTKKCPNCDINMHKDGQDIPFETFLGFEGDKVPDIDLNFSGVYQEKAHAYTKELFGEEYVYRAGTISTVAQKTAFGYVQGYFESMQQVNDSRAWKTCLASGAEGVKRTTGQHPGGIIVIPNSMNVHDFTPVQFPANNPNSKWLTTHFEFHDIDENVLKLDILGHVDPTAMKMLEKISGIDINDVPISDPATISLFSSPDALEVDSRVYHEKTGALGIPEFGTPFVRKMLEATKPDNFSDLVRISGLSHGTDVWRTNAEELIKNGLTLKDVIGCRDDIMVYLMQHGLEPKMSFDIMESVRKGRGLRDEWVDAMKENNIPSWYVDSCRKIKYMFPKAHAVAYVMMAMRVAWFKVHQPLAYYAVYFTLRVNAYEIETMTGSVDDVTRRLQSIQMRLQNYETKRDVTSKEQSLIDTFEVTLELLARGYKISPIDLYLSDATEFILDPRDDKAILPPFNVVDGLGDTVAQTVVEARKEIEFLSKQDLMSRTALSTSLVKKLDDLGVTRDLPETNQLSLF